MKFSGLPSRAARSAISRPISISDRGGGTLSTPARSWAGISSKRSSMEFTPMTCSICATSSGVWGMYAICVPYLMRALLGLFCQESLVGARAHERGGIGGSARLQAEQPPGAIRVFVEQFRLARQRRVVGYD